MSCISYQLTLYVKQLTYRGTNDVLATAVREENELYGCFVDEIKKHFNITKKISIVKMEFNNDNILGVWLYIEDDSYFFEYTKRFLISSKTTLKKIKK